MNKNLRHRPLPWLAAGVLATTLLPACAPLLIGGAIFGGSMVAIDRRTSGAQVEDAAIELKAGSRIGDLATLGHINVTSYNRRVLLTGEVPTENDKVRVGEAVRQMENVRGVYNELAVLGSSSLGGRSNDSILSAKVKATFVDAKDLQANTVKVVTERAIVYLMGIVSEREATRASDLARSVPGVQKVVRVFEVVSDAELAGIAAQNHAPTDQPVTKP